MQPRHPREGRAAQRNDPDLNKCHFICMSRLSDAQREAINEAYFARLTRTQRQQIEAAFPGTMPYTDWRVMVNELYAKSHLSDNNVQKLCDILTFVQELDWA